MNSFDVSNTGIFEYAILQMWDHDRSREMHQAPQIMQPEKKKVRELSDARNFVYLNSRIL